MENPETGNPSNVKPLPPTAPRYFAAYRTGVDEEERKGAEIVSA